MKRNSTAIVLSVATALFLFAALGGAWLWLTVISGMVVLAAIVAVYRSNL